MLLMVAQHRIKDVIAQNREASVNTPNHMFKAAKKIKLGTEITRGAKAIPRT